MTDGNLTHLTPAGEAHMVDVSPKKESQREARASARVQLQDATLVKILDGGVVKGDVFAAARHHVRVWRSKKVSESNRNEIGQSPCHAIPLNTCHKCHKASCSFSRVLSIAFMILSDVQ